MNKILRCLALPFAMLFFVAACDNDPKPAKKTDTTKTAGKPAAKKKPTQTAAKPKMASQIVGAWKIVEAKGSAASTNKGVVYTFRDDGTMDIAKITKAKYTFKNNVVEIHFSKTMKFVVDVTFSDKDTMIYKIRNSDQVFTMKRQ